MSQSKHSNPNSKPNLKLRKRKRPFITTNEAAFFRDIDKKIDGAIDKLGIFATKYEISKARNKIGKDAGNYLTNKINKILEEKRKAVKNYESTIKDLISLQNKLEKKFPELRKYKVECHDRKWFEEVLKRNKTAKKAMDIFDEIWAYHLHYKEAQELVRKYNLDLYKKRYEYVLAIPKKYLKGIAKKVGLKIRTVRRYIQVLCEIGILKILKERGRYSPRIIACGYYKGIPDRNKKGEVIWEGKTKAVPFLNKKDHEQALLKLKII